MSLLAELKRRNVVKVSMAYLALGWVVIEVTTTVTPVLNLPEWLPSVVVWIGIIGFPFVAMFSWIYELTPEGLKRESEISQPSPAAQRISRWLGFITIGLVAIWLGISGFTLLFYSFRRKDFRFLRRAR